MDKVDKKVVITSTASPSTSTVVNRVQASDTDLARKVDSYTTGCTGGGGDPEVVAGQYKSRGKHNKKKAGKYTPHGLAKCWAYTNLVVSLVEMFFSLYEIMASTTPILATIDSKDTTSLQKTIATISIALHGDCTDTPIEVCINFVVELFYAISSILFAFATTLPKEDFLISRCLVQWFMFSVWFPPLGLLPRFIINIVSTCGVDSARAFGPKWNEHGPRIVFWISNLAILFFLVAWLAHSRHVASQLLHYLKEVEQKHSAMKLIQSGSGRTLAVVAGSEMSVSHVGNAGDRVLERSPLSGILPSSLPMV